jgi:formate dehydrogenase subunit gamma
MMGAPEKSGYFQRFSLRQTIEHVALMIIFTFLAGTGLLQRFYTVPAAEWIILHVGGVETVRAIHRIFAFAFIGALVYHFGSLVWGLLVRRTRQSMLITTSDFSDVTKSLRYGLGLSNERPAFGRFNYRQKFEYWGLIFGSIIITVTGLILMFPVQVTSVLPGQFVAASVVMHGWEATLAVLTILVWHLYEVMLRPEIFPADTTIFTGRISAERLKEEHELEYVRLIEQTDVEPEAGS